MGRPRKKSLQFSTEDRNELQRIASSRTEPAARVSRARALLAYEDGKDTNAEIASEAGMSTVALANLVNKCITFGPMVALNDLPRSGRKSVITDEDKAYVKHIACYKPKDFGYPEELWSVEKLAKHILMLNLLRNTTRMNRSSEEHRRSYYTIRGRNRMYCP